MTAINTTQVTLVTATDPGYHPHIVPAILEMPFLASPNVVILGGDDLKNSTTKAATALALADKALVAE